MQSWKIVECDPADSRALECVRQYSQELTQRLGLHSVVDEEYDDYRSPDGAFFVVVLDDESTQGCAGIRTILTTADARAAELKRMWVVQALRGQGAGRALLGAVIDRARYFGLATLLLDTHRDLIEARKLYLAAGFVDTDRYNDNPHCTTWMERPL